MAVGQSPPRASRPAAEARTRLRDSAGARLARYLAIRLVLVIPTVLILVTVVFVLIRVAGDPITAARGDRYTPEKLAELKAQYGLDQPIWQQYLTYLGGIVRGDFGTTFTDKRPISEILVTYGAATVELMFWALIVAFLVGIPLGRLAARHHDRLADVSIRSFAILFYAAPVFFVGLLLKLLFSVTLHWLPASGRASPAAEGAIAHVAPRTNIFIIDAILYGDSGYILDVLKHAILPALALGLLEAGVFIRLVRINLLETLRTDYVTAARARGVAERKVVSKHAFRNAFIPVVTVMGMQIALMFGGAMLTETTFEWKGLGYKLSQYISAYDFIAVQGITTAIAVVVGLASFLVDAINAFIDPRVRY